VQRGAIHLRKNRYGSNAHLPAGANHAHSNFAAVCNEYLLEHSRNLDFSNKTGPLAAVQHERLHIYDVGEQI
jgi:hypothetical protein